MKKIMDISDVFNSDKGELVLGGANQFFNDNQQDIIKKFLIGPALIKCATSEDIKIDIKDVEIKIGFSGGINIFVLISDKLDISSIAPNSSLYVM
jgi:hypothetical protein